MSWEQTLMFDFIIGIPTPCFKMSHLLLDNLHNDTEEEFGIIISTL